jgi:glucose/arabinose dehydrogenase
LYVSVGEDGEPCEAQNLSKLQGKILRIDVASLPSSGSGPPPKSVIGPPSNPYADGDDNAALVYAYGLRNPFRFTIDPVTNDLFLGDVGQDHWDEIDRIPFHAAGANYGWPELEGDAIDPVPEADSCSTGPFAPPLFTYPHGPLGSSVICGPIVRPVVGGTYNFPVDYHGDLFLAEFYDGWIVRLKNGPTGWQLAPSVPGQPNPQQWLTGFGFVCDMQLGPDGALYIMKLASDLVPRGLYRIQHDGVVDAGTNVAGPAMRGVPNPAHVGGGFTVHFAPARASRALLQIYDPAGRLVRTLQGAARSGAIRWDGRTEAGRVAPAGVYAYRLDLGATNRSTGKVTLVR